MVVKCEVKFEQNPHGVFYSGQVMSGSVEITLDKPRTFKGIFLKLGGQAKCSWSQAEYGSYGSVRRTTTVRYSGHEQYLGTSATLIRPSDGIRVIMDGAAKAHWIEKLNTQPAAMQSTATGIQQHSAAMAAAAAASPQQQHYHYNRFKIVHYKASEVYLNTRSYLERGIDGNDVQLHTGVHIYAFQCLLPAQLPTSFEGKFGSIRYTIKVVMERPWKFDISHKIGITVLKLLDLNYDSPILRMPCQMEITKSFCWWPCQSGPLSLTITVPQTGYVPGESIVIQARVINLSGSDVGYMKFELRQLIVYHSQTPTRSTKEEQRSILQKRSAGVAQNNEERYEISLQVPSLPPTNANSSRIIFVSYDIRVEARWRINNNPFVEIPITIGNVPLQSVRHAYENAGMVRDDSTAAIQSRAFEQPTAPEAEPSQGSRTWPHQAYSELLPPSYEACIADAKEPDEDGEMPFTPRYPVYHGETTTQASKSSTAKNGNQ